MAEFLLKSEGEAFLILAHTLQVIIQFLTDFGSVFIKKSLELHFFLLKLCKQPIFKTLQSHKGYCFCIFD